MIDVLVNSGIKTPPYWSIEIPYSIADAKNAVAELLVKGPHPTALLCGNDVLAQGAIYAVTRAGLKVPDDISIIGIGDFKGSKEMEPNLTTVRLPARRIGLLAGKRLAHSIIHKQTEVFRMRCDIELIARGTCRPI
jgi:LacI family transcriptional regulator